MSTAEDEAVRNFHRERCLVAVRNGTVLLSPSGLNLSHREWLQRIGLCAEAAEQALREETRGFVYNHSVYLYRGNDFACDDRVEHDACFVVPALFYTIQDLQRTSRVYGGMRPGRPGKLWTPRRRLGTVAKYVRAALKALEKEEGL